MFALEQTNDGLSLGEGFWSCPVGDGAFFSQVLFPAFVLLSGHFATLLSLSLTCKGHL